MLEINSLSVHYGAVSAVRNVSIHVKQGEVVTLIGANGAGKTSIVKALSGLVSKSAGKVTFRNADITRLPAHNVTRLGLIHVPEGRKLVPNMTVAENLMCGAYCRDDKAGIASDFEAVLDRFPRLRERIKQQAVTMSGGERQMLAIGRALMARPELLILDEPSLGLAPLLVDEIFEMILGFKKEGKTILLIEQNAFEALAVSDRAYVLRVGEVVMTGTSADLALDPTLRQAYLGVS
ncbi:ABC transporter ATP-binding protein [Bradyrhizobium sp. CIR3A]|uniref:ABC transporter ATP-binding protein n=1 Tax=Bradyrhizobium sp. CIR3A TaxID=2663838 RepID=UPI0016064211|nr:ABC transporter ATP-binding protein [Bradyrhizobium sp. CIR3A]MBB4261353.1 branched-chain amino acid transport system ATP-binding protein [Bradyrhizobium sp. CIR3A]